MYCLLVKAISKATPYNHTVIKHDYEEKVFDRVAYHTSIIGMAVDYVCRIRIEYSKHNHEIG